MFSYFVCTLLLVECVSEQLHEDCAAHLDEITGDLHMVQKRGSKVFAGSLQLKQTPSSTNATAASTWKADIQGNEDCKCIGITLPGEILVAAENETVKYPGEAGATCGAWEKDRYPGCVGVEKPPEWCLSKWCYVDPCKCSIAVSPKKSSTNFKFQNKSLYWSYATCGDVDTFSATNEKACVNQKDENKCATVKDCAWDASKSKCLGKELVQDCTVTTLDEDTYGKAQCPCIGFSPRNGTVNLTFGDQTVVYPANVGGECKAWDKNVYPDCLEDPPPTWCASTWCYVDPCSCAGLETQPKESKSGALFQGNNVYWSYTTCGGVDTFTEDPSELPAFPPSQCPKKTTTTPAPMGSTAAPTAASSATATGNATESNATTNTTTAKATSNDTASATATNNATEVDVTAASSAERNGTAAADAANASNGTAATPAPTPAPTTLAPTTYPPLEETTPGMNKPLVLAAADLGMGECQCIGVDMQGVSPITVGDKTVSYPLSAGSQCKAWDFNVFPGCDVPEAPEWCAAKWCYVDPCKCTLVIPPKRSLTNGSWQGMSLYWSYATCGADDLFSKTLPTACVNQAGEYTCAEQEACAWDGAKCLGKELVEDCAANDVLPEAVYGLKSCRCVGWGKEGNASVTFNGQTAIYPASLGSNCSAWDNGVYPDCMTEDPPEWCLQSWCYVDPCTCKLPTQPKQTSTDALWKGMPVFWSYATCGGVDKFSDPTKLPSFPPEFCTHPDAGIATETEEVKSQAHWHMPFAGLSMLVVSLLSLF